MPYPRIIIEGPPECPLCFKRMTEIITRRATIYACLDKECMISINAKDPVCGKWRDNPEAFKDVICPRDGTQMRVFFRAIDGFMKCQCPKCRQEGRITQVVKGRVEDHNPNTPWNYDPEEK